LSLEFVLIFYIDTQGLISYDPAKKKGTSYQSFTITLSISTLEAARDYNNIAREQRKNL
jgi:hypothetical protein